ncbi:MAG TPA: winged helix-turn-helix domain-containing protein [Blastocatellia bacterium]|nr:winged helix-turn-helix domain-containing protein [Blastocatellia bacterium]
MSASTTRFYEFGPFRIDAERRLLLRDGEPVPLTPKVFDTLLLLVEHHGQVLEKEQMIAALWPDSFVEEGNLTYNISVIRKALGESPNERRYVITVPGRGYRFAADVHKGADDADVIVARYTRSTLVIHDQEPGPALESQAKDLPAAVVASTNRRKLILIGLALAALVLGAVAVYVLSHKGQPAGREMRAIAILPFVNSSPDPHADYLSDGITESLINSLSQLSQMKVMARTATFRYKGKEVDVQAIGRDLGVDGVITGRVTQQDDALIVQADLLNVADGSQVWGARYSRKLGDIFAVQEQIAKEIAGNLRSKLTGEDQQALSRRYTENFQAYQDYLLGWNDLRHGSRDNFASAISHFEKAIREEPSYALAYCALTEVYVSLIIRGYIDPGEGRRKAEEAARTALFLDPGLAEAHAALGETRVFFAPFDFNTGDRELRRAIELNPNLAVAHQLLAASLLEQGRLTEAIEAWQKARELDPLSAKVARLLAYSHLLKRDHSTAQEIFEQAQDLGPPFIILGEVEFYLQNGKLAEALVTLQKLRAKGIHDPLVITSEGMVYAAQGKRDEALRVINELEQLPGVGLSRAAWIARVYAVMNDKQRALDWLERGLQAGAIPYFHKDAPVWDTVRGEQRFQDLLRRMGIAQ